METITNQQASTPSIRPGRQYMIRRYEDSRRVRVEVSGVATFKGMRTIAIYGRCVRRVRGRTVVGGARVWSSYPELIEEVEQV